MRSSVPPNLHWVVDDIDKPWTYLTDFDFIFSRMMTGSFTDWPGYIQNCFKYAFSTLASGRDYFDTRGYADKLLCSSSNHGAYLEIQDITLPPRCDDDTYDGTALQKWGNLMVEAADKVGSPLTVGQNVKKIMEDAGYVDVVELVYMWPTNKWPAHRHMKEIGR